MQRFLRQKREERVAARTSAPRPAPGPRPSHASAGLAPTHDFSLIPVHPPALGTATLIQRQAVSDLLADPDVKAAIDEAWTRSFGHPPFRAAEVVDDIGMAIDPDYREGAYEGAEFRETFFHTDASGKPSAVQVSPWPLDVRGVSVPADATAYFHTHPTQKRAKPTETGATSADVALAADEKAAVKLKIPVYIIGGKTILKLTSDGKTVRSGTIRRP